MNPLRSNRKRQIVYNEESFRSRGDLDRAGRLPSCVNGVGWMYCGESDEEAMALGGAGAGAFMNAAAHLVGGIFWPYVNVPERSLLVWEREGWYWRKEVWMDTGHPDFPGDRT